MRRKSLHLGRQIGFLGAAQEFFAACYEDRDRSLETLCVAYLDEASRCVHLSYHGGDRISAPFPLKQILRDAVLIDSVGILLAHNHPSGDSRPSESDLASTRRLALVADALGCRLVDHLIFGDDCTSFRALGLL